MKTVSRVLCTVLCLLLLAGVMPAAGEEPIYVALGDSIADGYGLTGYTGPGSAPEGSFPVLLAETMGAKLVPLAVSGMDTDGLLQALDTLNDMLAVSQAQYISLTIGSNDLLHSAIQQLSQLQILAAEGDLRELLSNLGNLDDLLTSREAQALYAQKTAQFKENWEKIIARIRKLNPTADIYVTSFYNPYSMLEYSLGSLSLHIGSVAQVYLDEMNAWLRESPSAGEYRLAEIGDVSTNVDLSARILTKLNLDPHPDPAGHRLIHQRLRSLWREAEAERRYTDLPEAAWAREAIGTVSTLGLMQGVGGSRFAPEGQLTVAQVLALGARQHSLSHGGTASFDEGYGSHWYDVYYQYCVDNGLIDHQTFRDLTLPATRAQTALVLARTLEAAELPPIRQLDRIPDVSAGDYAAEEIYLLYRAGVLNGQDSRGSFAPNASLRRSEAAAILSRLAEPEQRITG